VADPWNYLNGQGALPQGAVPPSPPPPALGTTLNTMPSMNPTERDMMIRTIAGEAGGEPPAGQAAVAHVIMNRVADGGYGNGIQGVVTAPVKPGSSYHQFSVWNAPGMQDSSKVARSLTPNDPQYSAIGNIVDQVYSGQITDPTGGATHYYAPQSMPGRRPPPWAGPLAQQNQVKIGNQIFIGRSTGPGQTLPSQITGGFQDIGALSG
jgi:conjugal transfer mating pair stabilization protein TraG